jgi:hypothetical protein
VDQIDRWNGKSGTAKPPAETPRNSENTDAAIQQQAEQIAALTATVRQLEARLRGLEDLSLVAPRKPMHVRLMELVIGREYHRPWWRHSAVPGVTIVIPACSGKEDDAASTLRSVLRQSQAGWDIVVVGPEPGERLREALDAGAGRSRHVLVNGSSWDCLDKGLSEASAGGPGTVIGIVHPGQQLEPTAAASVMRFFRDHPRAMVAYFERTVRNGPWRMPWPRGKRMDVYALLAEEGADGWGHGGVFFRRRALGMVGGYKPAMRSAAEWHLYLRLTRMFGMRRAIGQVLCIPESESTSERCGEYVEFEQARQEFLGNFGFLGRVRCRVIEMLHRLLDAAEYRPAPPPLPINLSGDDIEPPPGKCPLSGKPPERLLFTAADAAGRPCYVYECPDGLGAMVCASGKNEVGQIPLGTEPELMQVLRLRLNPDLRVLVAGEEAADILSREGASKITRFDLGTPLELAALTLQEDQRFDVVWIGSALAEATDPAAVLRSLRSVMASNAIVAMAGPNFDSSSRKQLGPAWIGWDFPRRPIVLSRRGVLEMARLADLRVEWLNTRGDAWLALFQAE